MTTTDRTVPYFIKGQVRSFFYVSGYFRKYGSVKKNIKGKLFLQIPSFSLLE